VLGEPLYCLRRDFWAIEGRLAMGWSMDRQGIRTLFDRETRRLKQFELSGPRRERISLDTYPDELAAAMPNSVKKRDTASGPTQARSHMVWRCNDSRVS
jgi:hypothetical protein